MKKRILIIISVIFGILMIIGITTYLIEGAQIVLYNPLTTKMTESKRNEIIKQRQIDFLKAHEDEMTDYIRKNSAPDMKVTYDWDSIVTSSSMMFDPVFIQIRFEAEGSAMVDRKGDGIIGEGNTLTVYTNINRLDRIDRMDLSYPYKKRGQSNGKLD